MRNSQIIFASFKHIKIRSLPQHLRQSLSSAQLITYLALSPLYIRTFLPFWPQVNNGQKTEAHQNTEKMGTSNISMIQGGKLANVSPLRRPFTFKPIDSKQKSDVSHTRKNKKILSRPRTFSLTEATDDWQKQGVYLHELFLSKIGFRHFGRSDARLFASLYITSRLLLSCRFSTKR